MISFQLTDVKEFMKTLLISEVFDSYYLSEASITTYCSFFMDGRLHPEYYSTSEREESPLENLEFAFWKDMKSYCFQIVKGKNTPLQMKIVFYTSPEQIASLNSDFSNHTLLTQMKGFYLNIKYADHTLTCTTGTSCHSFQLDKSMDHLWDSYILSFFKENQIPYEIL